MSTAIPITDLGKREDISIATTERVPINDEELSAHNKRQWLKSITLRLCILIAGLGLLSFFGTKELATKLGDFEKNRSNIQLYLLYFEDREYKLNILICVLIASLTLVVIFISLMSFDFLDEICKRSSLSPKERNLLILLLMVFCSISCLILVVTYRMLDIWIYS